MTLGYAFVGYSHHFRRRTCHTIRKLVHQKMNGNGKRAAVNMVGSIKQLLKKLCVKDRYQEVKAGIVIRYQSEQSDLFLSE